MILYLSATWVKSDSISGLAVSHGAVIATLLSGLVGRKEKLSQATVV